MAGIAALVAAAAAAPSCPSSPCSTSSCGGITARLRWPPLNSKCRSWLWPHHRRKSLLLAGAGTTPPFPSSASSSAGRGLLEVIGRSVVALLVALLAGLAALRLRGMAQEYIQTRLLPPVAALVGERLGRKVELGRVHGMSPLGITLAACSVGPSERGDEVSCAQLPSVRIRVKPFRSIARGQLVADVILSHPHLLLCQKRDWTWLGLPLVSQHSNGRTRGEQQENDEARDALLHSRTKTRRLAKARAMERQAAERMMRACNAARSGYKLPVFETPSTSASSYDDDKGGGSGIWGSLNGPKAWLRDYLLKQPTASPVEKSRFQQINLEASAARARSLLATRCGEEDTKAFNVDAAAVNSSSRVHASSSSSSKGTRSQSSSDKGWEKQLDKLISNRDSACLMLLPPSTNPVALALVSEEEENEEAEEKQVALPTYLDPLRDRVNHLWSSMNVAAADNAASKMNSEASAAIALESVYIRDGTLMLLAYGDDEPRLVDELNGRASLGSDYQLIDVQLAGCPKAWATPASSPGLGAFLNLAVNVDIKQQKWDVKAKVYRLHAPLLERLLEVPLDFYGGTVHGEVHVWMNKEDLFPNLGGKVDIRNLRFKIWEAPSAFKELDGTLFLQGQRAFLHNTTGLYGNVPLSVSGDMDLNPVNGEYRLSCQVAGIELNSLMETLNVRPLPFAVAGAVKAVVYCRGPLDAPIFEGSAETVRNRLDLTLSAPRSSAGETVRLNAHRGAAAAYDRVAFSTASASFTFDTDSCIANVYGIRATPVGGGEIRGAGDMWICPEAETDPTAVRVDCSGHVMINHVIEGYGSAALLELPSFGAVHGEAKVRGSLLLPVFDIKWVMPDAKGSFNNSRGDIAISDEAISFNSSSFTFDVSAKISAKHVPLAERKANAGFPAIEALETDVRLRGFDMLDLITPARLRPPDGTQMKMTGKFKFQGRVTENSPEGISGLAGDVSLSGVRLNQLLVASHSNGVLELSKSSVKLNSSGRGKDHLLFQISPDGDASEDGSFFSLQRGQLQVDASYSPRSLAKLEIRNFPLDELEVASLRGMLQKVDVQLNLEKRRGHGCLSVRRPRFSGIHGELLDVSARWSGDVVTLEKSLLEQANSTYELRGEYVLPGPRDSRGNLAGAVKRSRGMWQKMMAGHLGNVIASLGRWRLRLEVPKAELADMLPVARLLSRSSDPAILTRSKELFLQGVEKAAFLANNLKQEMEYIKRASAPSTQDEGLPDSVLLPGLTELKGHWHGTLEASGGGNSDITANIDLHGENWEWGAYNIQNAVAIGSYCYADGLRLEKVFLQNDTATLHADGILSSNSNLHFALLNFPVELVPPLMQAIRSSSAQPLQSSAQHAPLLGVLHMEGDLRGDCNKPDCDVHVRLLDGAAGGINLNRADLAASVTSGNQLVFHLRLEPVVHPGHVHIRGSIPLGSDSLDQQAKSRNAMVKKWMTENNLDRKESKSGDDKPESWQGEAAAASDWDFIEARTLYVDALVKDGGMMLLTALTPNVKWLQGNADVRLQVRGAVEQPKFEGGASFHKVVLSSPMLPRPIVNLGGTITVKDNELFVDGLEGKAGKRGRLLLKGKLPLQAAASSSSSSADGSLDLKVDSLEVRARNAFSGQVDGQVSVLGGLYDPELTGFVKLSAGQIYLSQEKNAKAAATTIPRALSDLEVLKEETRHQERKLPVAVRLKGLKLQFGPELRMIYPLILNFAVNGELEFYGFADAERIKPKGVLTFENGDVNLVATQVRLNKDYLNRARFEPDQGLDPNLDLALVGVHWQLKVQGRAQNWQDSLVLTSSRSGEQDALTRVEAAKLFENQLVDSLLEGNGQFAFKKLAAATVETLMPKIETKGEFGQARWRLVYAPQIPNLLSLDPSTDPFKSLAFGTEVEVRLGKHLQASVVRQLKESEIATQWTLIYHLSSKLRLVFTSIPSVDNRLLVEYSASS